MPTNMIFTQKFPVRERAIIFFSVFTIGLHFMNKISCLFVFGALFSLGAPGVQAQQEAKAGLWEIRSTVEGDPRMAQAMAEAQKMMAQMPPEVRKTMEAQGMGMGTNGSTRMCLTKEMLAHPGTMGNQKNDCTNSIVSRTANTFKSKFTCKNPPSSGEITVTFSGDSSYTSQIVSTSPESGTQTIKSSGKWLQADCGNIKPIALPQSK